ncbi:MAG: SIS domain-containing protein [Candidatus Hydrogenedentes bacterium]|nr:SIS domain-containing protein [Candidatus Hydrogenedentota bacterium]
MLSFDDYLSGLNHALEGIDREVFNRIVETVRAIQEKDKIIYVCGNGGSAATASHMINDLVKAPADASGCRPFRAIGLTDCIPLMTALANDIEYAQMFSRQLNALGREGDLLIAISGSGNSPNVLEAAKTARERGMQVIGMTGYDGGKLGALSDLHLNVPCHCMAQVEDAHLVIEHALVESLKVVMGGKSSAAVAPV